MCHLCEERSHDSWRQAGPVAHAPKPSQNGDTRPPAPPKPAKEGK